MNEPLPLMLVGDDFSPQARTSFSVETIGEGRALLGKARQRKRAASRPTKANSRYDPQNWRIRA